MSSTRRCCADGPGEVMAGVFVNDNTQLVDRGMTAGVRGDHAPHTVETLYIFPHAGGSARSYVPFARAFSSPVRRVAVQYPGHADRHDVPDIGSIPTLAGDVYDLLAAGITSEAPVAFFGHSMGGLIAFEVARKFEASGKSIAALFLSASPAPGHGGYQELHQSTDGELLKMVADMTGTDTEFIGDRFGATILRTLRNYGAITEYNCPPGTTVACPIYAYAAADDTAVSYERVAAWSAFTTAAFDIRVVAGDHFFVTEKVGEVVDDIERRLASHGNGR